MRLELATLLAVRLNPGGPVPFLPFALPLRVAGDLCLAHKRWAKCLVLALVVHELAELEREPLNLGHVLVEELDDRPELVGNHVRYEHQAHPPRCEVGLDLVPEGLW